MLNWAGIPEGPQLQCFGETPQPSAAIWAMTNLPSIDGNEEGQDFTAQEFKSAISSLHGKIQ
jgi:hypothetical protein